MVKDYKELVQWHLKFSTAVETGDLDVVKQAVAKGVSVDENVDDGYESPAIICAASEGHYDVVEYLLEEGARQLPFWGHMPVDYAKTQGHNDIADLLISFQLPEVLPHPQLSKESLLAIDDDGNALLDSRGAWQNFAELAQDLKAKGDALGKADLLRENSRGISWLAKAANMRCLGAVLDYLAEEGQNLTAADLVQENEAGEPAPTGTLQTIAMRGEAGALFQKEYWQGKNGDGIRQIYQALPEQAQATVGNYHQLLAHCRIQQRQALQGRV